MSGQTRVSEIDKKILKSLVTSKNKVSSLALSRNLEIPLTTVQRRRKRLESEYVEVSHSMKLDIFGWRSGQLFISTQSGMIKSIGRRLLSYPQVICVTRSIGEHTIDLCVEVLFKDNKELVGLIDQIKAMDGVKDVIWAEKIETLGRNNDALVPIIDQL